MNQGELEVVKQELARVNINILGISELKWIRMGEFNSDDHYIYYYGQESLKRKGVALIVNRRVQNESKYSWVQSLKQQNDLSSFPSQIIQYHRNPSLCPITNAKEAEAEWFYRDLQDFQNYHQKKKKSHFHHRRIECKSRKSRDTWSNWQVCS